MGITKESDLKISTLFVKIMLLIGLLMVFIVPPFQMADEDSHFKKAFLVSTGVFFSETNPDGVKGNYLPNAVLNFEDSHRYLINNINNKYNFEKFYLSSSLPVDYTEKTFVSYSTMHTNPILYIPQAIFMFLTRVLFYLFGMGNSSIPTPATYMYAGRIGNLLFYMGCMYLSLKYIPFYKRLVFLLAIMPMSISLASSLSYDAMVIGVCFLTTSLILYLVFNNELERITKKWLVVLVTISIVLIELKQVYYPLILMLIFIPSTKFITFKRKIFYTSAIIGTGVLAHLIWMLISATASPAATESSYVKDQLFFILSHPFEYIVILARTVKELMFFYLNSFVGNLGWLDTNFPPLFIFLYLLILIFVAIVDTNNKIRLTYKFKLLFSAIFVMIFILVETSLYLVWTSLPEIGGVGHEIVSGVQGRYFIPFVLLLLALLYSNKFPDSIKEKIITIMDRYISTFAYYCCGLTLFVLIVRYWVS